MMNRILSLWLNWWTRSSAPQSLAFVRVAVGIYLFFYFGRYLPKVTTMLSESGVPLPLFNDYFFTTPHSEVITLVLFGLLLLGCIGLALGFFMRSSILLILVIGMHFWMLSFHLFPASFHRIIVVVLLSLLFSGADRTFSLRMKRERGSFSASSPISILPQRIIALQISATYLGAGWVKIALPAWKDGEMLAYSMMSGWTSELGFMIARLNIPIVFYDHTTLAIKLFLFALPFGLWIRPVQRWFFVGGIIFHTTIAVLLSIWSFLLLPFFYILFIKEKRILR